MKRKRYIVEGDLLDRHSKSNGQRYMASDEAICEPSALTESFFSFLPIEVTCLIVRTIAYENDAIDLQSFLCYLLPLHGILTTEHRTFYDTIQTTLLMESQNAVRDEISDLFSVCYKERLDRIDSTTKRVDSKMAMDKQMASLKALVNAPFIELFTFINSRVCEHCLNDLAITRLWERVNFSGVQADDDLVPLCSYCGECLKIDYKVKDSTRKLNYPDLRATPKNRYRWMSPKKCYRWCGGNENAMATSIRKKSYITNGKSDTLYLLQDALPFIKERYIINRKKGQSLTFSEESCDDEEDGVA
jgi:hypothetical protein